VLLHGRGGDEEKVIKLSPKISRRNFVCMSLRGPKALLEQELLTGYSWGLGNQLESLTEDYIFKAVENARRQFHIHSERIFLVGFCEGATQAYRIGLAYPNHFAGVASLNGLLPRSGRPLARIKDLREKPIFHAHGLVNSVAPLTMAQQDSKLLQNAGLKLTTRTYPTNHRIHVDMLRDLNSWVVEQICKDEE